MSAKRSWFTIQNAATDDGSSIEILVYEPIGDWLDDYFGFGVTAKAFVEQLEALPDSVKTIRLRVNSPGGDVFGAVTIANALREQRSKGRTVDVFVDGLAASAASIIIMAGDTIRIADNGMVFVHNPITAVYGNADTLEKTAGDLRTIRNTIVATYKWHSKLSDEELVALMDAETWMDADAAIEKGFATEKIEGLKQSKTSAQFGASAMARLSVPERLKARVAALIGASAEPQPPAAVEAVFAACRLAGLPEFAESLITAKASSDEVKTRIAAEKQSRAAAKARVDGIKSACALAGMPQLADGYVRGAMSVDDVRAHIVIVTALRDNIEIDGALLDGLVARHARGLSPNAIYAERNRA